MDELARLVVRERAVSRRRRQLHELIDRLYLAAPLDEVDIVRLERLEASEHEISARRQRLHREIDALRARVGLPSWRVYRRRDSAA